MRHFNLSEFDSPDAKGSGENMDAVFLEMLDEARERANTAFKITSGYRTTAYNDSLLNRGYKASKTSSHLKGLAADIYCVDAKKRWKIINALISVGFTRIGIASNFIHVDNDPDKPDNMTWTY